MSQAKFGEYLRKRRTAGRSGWPLYSVRGLAAKVGVAACYISKVERGETGPPSEDTICRIAEALGEDPDILLALAGKVSSDLQDVIRKRPRLFAELIRQLRDAPDPVVHRVVREVREEAAEYRSGPDAHEGGRAGT